MRWRAARLGALCALVLCAQTSQDPEVTRAQAELARTRFLVEAGVAAPVELEKARQAVSEAEEHALLRRTLYGHDATEADAEQMLEIAARRLERRQQQGAEGREGGEQGGASPPSVTAVLELAEAARKE